VTEQMASKVGPSGIDVAYERFGDPQAPPVLLIMGGGAQMIAWPDGFCAGLAGRDLQVIRFDSRDAGRSTHFPDAPAPDMPAALAGDYSSASYTLSDMAADTVGLLDALGLASAHLVGASLGGMVAQTMAIEDPGRVRSLTSMMSTTGDRSVGQANFAALGALGPAPEDRAGYIDWQLRAFGPRGSPSTRQPWRTGPAAHGTATTIAWACCARPSRCWPRGTGPRSCTNCTCLPWCCTATATTCATSAAGGPPWRPSPAPNW
jgi:pimeloyl-ACP methyl ester carboxylesterase